MKELSIISSKPQIVKQLSQKLGCSTLFAHILAARGFENPAEAARFLKAPLSALNLENCLYDMDRAVERIVKALQKHEHILVFGDYDVDGITATLTLCHFLRDCGAKVSHYIPHRMDEGYGLFPHHIENFSQKPDLIVTVDCGAGSRAAIQCARQHGIDVVVSDHHRVEEDLPEAWAFVNPKRPQCQSGKTYLCGAGIVFLLLIHLRRALRKLNFWEDSQSEPNLKNYCDLAALGTIADVSPLVGENRVIVKAGLQIINTCCRPGLKALIEQNCTGDAVDVQAAAFRLIPALNAAGRMQHADLALALLSETDSVRAQKQARELLQLNRKRQQQEQETLQAILDVLNANPALLSKKVLVVTGQNWHEGILGILAARLAERYAKPTLVISERNGMLKGSGRSPAWLDLFKCLTRCSEHLSNFGGHRLAAGLSLPAANLDAFTTAFENAAEAFEPQTQTITCDAEIRFEQITPRLLNELDSLAPFGEGNPEPLFVAFNVHVADSRPIGGKGRHLKLKLRQGEGAVFDGVHFNYDTMRRPGDKIERLLLHLRWNEWQGQKKVQIIVAQT